MPTDYSHRTIAHLDPRRGLVGRAMLHVRQLVCGLHGHDALLHFGDGRISLQCSSCGYESPGWDVRRTSARPEAVVEERGRMIRLPLLGQRRVA
jgi:hypothetical protein